MQDQLTKDEENAGEQPSVRARRANEPEPLGDWLEKKRVERERDRAQRQVHVEALINRMNFAQRLSAIRKSAKLSQADLANLAGTNPSQVAKIEAGLNTNPTLETVVAVLAPLGYTLDIVPIQPAR